MASGDVASVDLPEQDEDVAVRRGPKLAIAAVGVAWLTMAVLGVTIFRPELAEVGHVAERAVAAAGQPTGEVPLADPASFAGGGAAPARSSPSAVVLPPRPAHSSQPSPSTATPTPVATAPSTTPARTPSAQPSPSTPATSTGQPSTSAGSTGAGLPSAVSNCSQAANASSISSIIKAVQACASGLGAP